MRPESNNNSLDLNNYPEDYSTRDSRHVMEEGSSSCGKDGKDEERGKVYECRFCSLKFCKSQALGGHMNRHRQERETETLNRARQLVFSNDNPAVALGDPLRSMYQQQPRLFTAAGSSSSTMLQPPTIPPQGPPPPLLYTSPIPLVPYPSQYPQHSQQPPINDYYVSHATPQYHLNYMGIGGPDSTNYTCVGAPVGQVLGHGSARGSNVAAEGSYGGRDGSVSNQEEGLSWGRSNAGI